VRADELRLCYGADIPTFGEEDLYIPEPNGQVNGLNGANGKSPMILSLRLPLVFTA